MWYWKLFPLILFIQQICSSRSCLNTKVTKKKSTSILIRLMAKKLSTHIGWKQILLMRTQSWMTKFEIISLWMHVKRTFCRGINLQHDGRHVYRSAIKGFYGSCSLYFIKPFFTYSPRKFHYALYLPHRHNRKGTVTVSNVILWHAILRFDPSCVWKQAFKEGRQKGLGWGGGFRSQYQQTEKTWLNIWLCVQVCVRRCVVSLLESPTSRNRLHQHTMTPPCFIG